VKVGDFVRIARYHFGNDQVRETGVIIDHQESMGGFDIWTVYLNETGKRGWYNTGELRILDESR
jgi:hypothetical protein